MKYLLDTNICIHFLRGNFNLSEKFAEEDPQNFAISEITYAELVFGAENSNNPEKNTKLVEQFIEVIKVVPVYNSIRKYAKEKVRLRKKVK